MQLTTKEPPPHPPTQAPLWNVALKPRTIEKINEITLGQAIANDMKTVSKSPPYMKYFKGGN